MVSRVLKEIDPLRREALFQPTTSMQVDETTFNCYFNNVQSLRKNFANFASELNSVKCQLIFLVETWLDETDHSSLFSLAGYCMHRDDFILNGRARQHAGIVCYTRTNFQPVISFLKLNSMHFCVVTVGDVTWVCVHRRPSCTSLVELKDAFSTVFENIASLSVIIIGDFNDDALKHTAFANWMRSKGLEIQIEEPTTDAETALDLVFWNEYVNAHVYVMESMFSFHKPLIVKMGSY